MFVKGLIGYLPAQALQGLVGFATLIAFTRLLSPEDYGRYAIAFGVTSLGHSLIFTWLEAAMARFYPNESREQRAAPALFGTLYRLFAAMVALMGLVALIIWLWPVSASATPLKWAILSGLLSAVFRSLAKLVLEQRRSEGRVAAASSLDMLQTSGGFLIGLGLAWLGLGASAPLLGAGLIALLALPFYAREDWGRALKGRFDPQRAKAYADYGLPVSLSLIMTLSLFTADRLLIGHYLGEADAGAYHAGFSLASRIIDVLFIWLGAAGTPALVHALEHGGPEGLKTAARHQITTMAYLTFPAAAGLIAVAEPLCHLMIGEALHDKAILITPLITLGAVLSGLNSYYFLQAFTLAKKTRLLSLSMLIPAVTNIALNIALIPPFGLMGAAWASLIAFALGTLSAIWLGRGALRMPLAITDLAKTALAAAAMMYLVAIIPVPDNSRGTLIEVFVKSVSGGAIYAAFAWGMNLNETRALSLKLFLKLRRCQQTGTN